MLNDLDGGFMNVYYSTIVFVKDLKKSKDFYSGVLGLKIEIDYDTIVAFENHFVIHDGNELLNTVFGKRPSSNRKKGKRNLLIYFETDDLEKSFANIKGNGADIIHGIKKQHWGQKVFRFYDPDGHIVEIGEAMHYDYLKKDKAQ